MLLWFGCGLVSLCHSNFVMTVAAAATASLAIAEGGWNKVAARSQNHSGGPAAQRGVELKVLGSCLTLVR